MSRRTFIAKAAVSPETVAGLDPEHLSYVEEKLLAEVRRHVDRAPRIGWYVEVWDALRGELRGELRVENWTRGTPLPRGTQRLICEARVPG